ncbi:MAG: T9SS type A sorting domain-containing protein [Bacteroidota bacterium]
MEPFPNPAGTEINFWFVLPNSDDVKLILYDAKGSLIESVFSGTANKGLNQFTLDITGLRKGVYVFRFVYLDEVHVRSFVKY